MRRALWLAAATLWLVGCLPESIEDGQDPGPYSPGHVQRPSHVPQAQLARLRLGIVPYIATSRIHQRYEPLRAYLQTQLKVPVETEVADGYTDLGRRMQQRRVEVGIFSPLSYVQARQLTSIRPILTSISRGSLYYRGYFITSAPNIRQLGDVRGASLAFVDPSSTSGFLYALQSLKQAGLDLHRDLGEHSFIGTHDAVVSEVAHGCYQVGVVESETLLHMQQSMDPHVLALRIIGKTERIPHDLVALAPHVDEASGDAIKWALYDLSTKTVEGRTILQPLAAVNGFVPATDKNYAAVQQVLEANREDMRRLVESASPPRRCPTP